MSGSRCARCDIPVDPLRSSAIVAGGRVVSVCRGCADGGGPESPEFLSEYEPWRRCRCGRPIAPGAALTVVIGGSVELRCGRCEQPEPKAPRIVAPAPVVSRTTSPQRFAAIAALVVAAGVGTYAAATRDRGSEPRTLAMSSPSTFTSRSADSTPTETPNLAPIPEPELAQPEPIETDDIDSYEIDDIELGPPEDGEVVDVDLSGDWVHPIAGTTSRVPTSPSRQFGAERPGSRPSECGGGHCGVDLGGTVGTPVVAVKAGVVVRIEERTNRRSGRYVRVRHSGGTVTWYMHLHDVAPGLAVGTPVKAGQRLGSLGSSGIHSSQPHLHFSVQAPRNSTTVRYVDPVPLLESAAVIDPIDVIDPVGDLEL